MSWKLPRHTNHILASRHYLGPTQRGIAWHDPFGIIVIASPTSRRLPLQWLELVRWCITSEEKNAGSRQWGSFIRALKLMRPDVTTIVSYSDPSMGHTGALYRACNWLWAPTWHRFRQPPTGNGSWSNAEHQAVKDRWVYLLRDDTTRVALLEMQDESILKRYPWARYSEPRGVPFRLAQEVLPLGSGVDV
jgi:hypothetical protein